MRLAGKAAIVTGAGRGIGRAIAARFAAEGALVVAADVDGASADETARAIEEAGGRAIPVAGDAGEPADAERTVQSCLEAFGRLDVLVNNAGIGATGPVDGLPVEAFDRVMACNLRGMWMGCHFAVPQMKRAGGGAILSIASVQGIQGWENTAAYAGTKAGILGATRALAVELAPFGIRVNAVCPGAIRVCSLEERVARRLGPQYVEDYRRRFADRVEGLTFCPQPLPRTGLPEDIANAALFLASEEASFITGTHLVVDGGMTAAHYEPNAETSPGAAVRREVRAWILDTEARNREAGR